LAKNLKPCKLQGSVHERVNEDTDTVGDRGTTRANALLVVVPTATDIESATESTRLINRNVSGE
jgi:hypothetical protein